MKINIDAELKELTVLDSTPLEQVEAFIYAHKLEGYKVVKIERTLNRFVVTWVQYFNPQDR